MPVLVSTHLFSILQFCKRVHFKRIKKGDCRCKVEGCSNINSSMSCQKLLFKYYDEKPNKRVFKEITNVIFCLYRILGCFNVIEIPISIYIFVELEKTSNLFVVFNDQLH